MRSYIVDYSALDKGLISVMADSAQEARDMVSRMVETENVGIHKSREVRIESVRRASDDWMGTASEKFVGA